MYVYLSVVSNQLHNYVGNLYKDTKLVKKEGVRGWMIPSTTNYQSSYALQQRTTKVYVSF